MIALSIPARAEAEERFVARLGGVGTNEFDAVLVGQNGQSRIYSGRHGLFELNNIDSEIDGDVVAVDPRLGIAERLIRNGSPHNTLLVTERCDQLCVMCSQPPKKHHVDRWAELTQAALLAPEGQLIGISGGEPTLYKHELFAMLDDVLTQRPDLSFHVLTNGQHFVDADHDRLASPHFGRVAWGIPMYSADPAEHDEIVAKPGAHETLRESFAILLEAGAHIELRTVVINANIDGLPQLAEYVASHLGFVDQWSIMQLESIGFAKRRFSELSIEPETEFPKIAEAIDIVELFGISVALFNFPLCTVPDAYRGYAVRSISDWKQKYASACAGCSAKNSCGGFFEWHPEQAMKVTPL